MKLDGIIKIYNNAAMAQFRNICERKVRILKRFLKMGLSGQTGPQVGSIRMDVYLTIIEQAVHELKTIPYLKAGNFGILTPEYFINPWANSSQNPGVTRK